MRHLLSAIAVVFTLISSPLVHAEDVHYYLTAGMNGIVRMHDGNTFPVWGFSEETHSMGTISVPGPTIRAREGDHVFLHFFNMSMLPHTIHPHGLDVPQDVDGVPQTSFEIPMMGSYTYDFVAPHAGTYGYHCHVHTVLHLQMGMYGTVVIESPDGEKTVWEGGPAFDIERIWGTGEFDSYWHDNAGGGMGPGGDMGPGGGEISDFPFHDFNPDYFIVNGKSGTDIHGDSTSKVEMNTDETLLLRLVNIGGYLPHRVMFNGLPATAVSSDGRPLPIQEAVDEITVYPGERYDVIIKPNVEGNYEVDIEYLSIYDASIQGMASVPIIARNVAEPLDTDGDGVLDITDNCSNNANPGQEDTYPPGGNGIGDVCDCEGNFDGDNDCDGADAAAFKADFGRSGYNSPCESTNPCNGDFDCDNDCDGADAAAFKADFGRSEYNNPCSPSGTEPWCVYP